MNGLITAHIYGVVYKKSRKNMKAFGGIPVKIVFLDAPKNTTKTLKP